MTQPPSGGPQQPPQWQQPPAGFGYPGFGYPGYAYPGYQYGPPPSSNLGWAIAALILFWPLGIPAIIYSTKVESLWNRGDAAGATRAARIARTCGIWALVAAAFFFVVFLIIFGIAVSSFSDCANNGC